MKKWVALLLAGFLAIPHGMAYAEELTDGEAEESIVEELILDNAPEELCYSEDKEEIVCGGSTEEQFNEQLYEETEDELAEAGANTATATITGAYNSSKGGDIRWSKVSGAAGYVLYRMRAADGLKKVATINNPNTVQYIDSEIKDNCWGRVYTYYIRPLFHAEAGSEYYADGQGITEGSKSNEVVLQRLAPMKFTQINSNTAGQVSLTWACTVNSNKAVGYEIQYASSTADLYGQKGSFKKVSVSGRNNLRKTINGLAQGATCYFRIRCYVNYTHSITKKTTKTWSQYSDVKKVTVRKEASANWKSIYRNHLSENVELTYETYNAVSFALHDINSDGTPELITSGGLSMDYWKIFTVKGNAIRSVLFDTGFTIYSNGVIETITPDSDDYVSFYRHTYMKMNRDLWVSTVYMYADWFRQGTYSQGNNCYMSSSPKVAKSVIDANVNSVLGNASKVNLRMITNNASNRAQYFG